MEANIPVPWMLWDIVRPPKKISKSMIIYLLMTSKKGEGKPSSLNHWVFGFEWKCINLSYHVGGNSKQFYGTSGSLLTSYFNQPVHGVFRCPCVDSISSHNSHRDTTRSSKPAWIMVDGVIPCGEGSSRPPTVHGIWPENHWLLKMPGCSRGYGIYS